MCNVDYSFSDRVSAIGSDTATDMGKLNWTQYIDLEGDTSRTSRSVTSCGQTPRDAITRVCISFSGGLDDEKA